MAVLKSEVIKTFLNAKTHADLAALYHKGMEVQVNVGMDEGRRIETGGPGTKPSIAYTDGVETWRPYRIPSKAMSEPVDNDGPQQWDFEKHVEGIGLTGWNWQEKKSIYVAYDFDAMMGHSDNHAKKLTEAQLNEIQSVVTNLPFVTLRRSTSGRGLHLYVFLEPITTVNHTEHAALARAILSYMTGITGFNFTDKVDICGGNMWIWNRKMLGTNGLTLVRQGQVFPASKIPGNWRDHLNVISRKTTRVVPQMDGVSPEAFQELSGCRSKVALTPDHLKIVNWLHDKGYPGWWDADNHMLITHTYYLKEAFGNPELKIRGFFDTVATGREIGFDINCFMFPAKNGAWAVRRYGQGTKETKNWIQDGKGWTRGYFNRDLTLGDVARMYDAVELESGGFQFPSCTKGCEALLKIGVEVSLPPWITGRAMRVRDSRQDYKVVVSVPTLKGDATADMAGWLDERGFYRRLFNNPLTGAADDTANIGDYDDVVRHIVSENGQDLGWVISTDDGDWREEPIPNVKLFLVSRGIGKKDIEIILGRAVNQAWRVVNRPFEPEYPGDREWNRSHARFRIAPTLDGESLSFPTWMKVMMHCGRSLDEPIQSNAWCQANGITNGAEYLKLWLASLFKHPQCPLPYLAFYGPQDSGKSTFHEAVCQLLLDGGYMDGALALASQANFNGELQDAILCTLEEVDLRKSIIYQKVKDWVTSAQISIHVKGMTPYKAPNFTHWIQCVNDRDYIPVFPGDTRITVMFVDALTDEQKVPKRDLWTLLTKEAPDFLAALLGTDIPDSKDRLMVPVIKTSDKIAAEYNAMNPVEQWFKDNVHPMPGNLVKLDDAYQAFSKWLNGEDGGDGGYGKNKFSGSMPQQIVCGRCHETRTQFKFLGNVTLDEGGPAPANKTKFVQAGLFIKRENAK